MINRMIQNRDQTINDLIDTEEQKVKFKYNEDLYLKEIYEYVKSTYGQHYSKNKYQATEFIIDSGHGTGFCIGNVLKYAQRYGRKEGYNRADLLKIIHYAVIQLYAHDYYEYEHKNKENT